MFRTLLQPIRNLSFIKSGLFTLCGHDDRKISESKILHGASSSYSFAFAMLNELRERKISVGNKTTLR